MKLLRQCVHLGLGASFVLAAQSGDMLQSTIGVSTERERIAGQRAMYEADFSKAQEACFARFAVTDCQREAKRVRRVALDDLRRQELILNDLDRQTKAMAEINRIEGNFTPERQQEQAQQHQQAEQEAMARQQRSDEKQTSVFRSGSNTKAIKKSDAPSSISGEPIRQQQIYDTKIEQAQQHKAERAKSWSEKPPTPAKPLSLPTQ